MKKVISKLIRNKYLFPFWKFLNKLSFYGMNYGVASGYANYSGELFIIKYLKGSLNNGVIFDVGANIGDWSKFFIKECYLILNYSGEVVFSNEDFFPNKIKRVIYKRIKKRIKHLLFGKKSFFYLKNQ